MSSMALSVTPRWLAVAPDAIPRELTHFAELKALLDAEDASYAS